MEGIVVPVIEAIWTKLVDSFSSREVDSFSSRVVDSFSSRVVDQTVDNAFNRVMNIADSELIFANLKKNLKSLSAKAADVEEEMTNLKVSARKKRKREVEEWLEEVKSITQVVVELGRQIDSEGFVTRLTDGGKAAELDKQVEKLVEQSRNFGELVHDVHGTSGETLLTNGLVGEAFNENLENILRLLKSREVSSIGVYGMGGVGKTALVKHIYNQLLQRSEGHVFWVTVSREYTIMSLQDKIARCLGVDLSDEDKEDERACRLLRAFLEMNNSVLILDDVWDYIEVWKVGCYIFAERCRLIITTRSFRVCARIGCQCKILIETLNEGEAWKLFNETLEIEKELAPEVEREAKSMVKLCGGLPLRIIRVAESMRGEGAKRVWENAYIELKEQMEGKDSMGDDEAYKVLKLSFDWLNRNDQSNEFSMTQLCFLYCLLYPEDYEIDREGLVRKLISEGLVSERTSRREQVQQGHSILGELVDVCLLESCVVENSLKCVKMHSVMRSMALKICEGKHMVRPGEWSLKEIHNEKEWTEDLEKVSLVMCDQIRRIEDGTSPNCEGKYMVSAGEYSLEEIPDKEEWTEYPWIIEEGISPNCPKLSTLLLLGNRRLSAISNSFFSKMQGLCTLDLCKTNVRMLPNSVCDLISLKALLLENCTNLVYVPNLGRLKELRELDLSGTAIKEVPQGLDNLLNLEFLSLAGARRLKKIPSGLLQKLVCLQQVSTPFHMNAPMEGIQNLKLLEEFNGSVRCVEDFNCFIRSKDNHQCDTWYTIIVGEHDEEEGHSFKSSSYERKLDLSGCNLEGARVLGQNTDWLMISGCEGLSIFFLDDFPGLRMLRIEFCRGIECILRGQGSQLSNTLEVIELVFLDDLKGVMQTGEIGASASAAQPAAFSSLKQIHIRSCNKMRKVGLRVSGVPNLELISIGECGEMEEIFEDEGIDLITTLPKLNQLSLHGMPRLRKVGLPVSGVPNLEVLGIVWCKEIEKLFKDEGIVGSIVTTLPKLKELNLEGLARLRKVGLVASQVPNLERISIESCGEIEEIFEDEGRNPTILPKLKCLILHGLPRLRKVGLQVEGVPNLEDIHIRECGEIEEIFEEDVGGFDSITTFPSKLRHLTLSDLPRLNRVSPTIIVASNIQTISLTKCPRMMKTLPLLIDDPPPPNLRRIEVEREWWESLKWVINSNLPSLLLPFLHFQNM